MSCVPSAVGSAGSRALVLAAAIAVLAGGAAAASGQIVSVPPVKIAGVTVLVAGDVSATYGGADPGWFLYTNYETSALRRLRAGITVDARPVRWLAFVADVRAETGAGVRAYAWFVRITPLRSGLLSFQAGRIPPVFGARARRSYPQDNPLVADPLMYQYLTNLRPDAVPASADDLIRMRGRGWLASYPVGNRDSHTGVPLIDMTRWDSGIEGRVGTPTLEAAAAVTAGTLSNPRSIAGPIRPQVSGHLAWRPAAAVTVGASFAHGTFFDQTLRVLRPDLQPGHDSQSAAGIDADVSAGRWLVRGELVFSQWRVPSAGTAGLAAPLGAGSAYLESRLKLWPGVFVAARADRLWFSTVAGSTASATWDANVTRLEAGAGWTIRRGLLVKASGIANWRDGGRVRREYLAAVQLVAWF